MSAPRIVRLVRRRPQSFAPFDARRWPGCGRLAATLAASLVAAVLVGLPAPGRAGGFQLPTLCVKCLGSADAGAAALAQTPSTLAFNPAGLALLQGRQLEAGLNRIRPVVDYTDDGSTDPFGSPLSGPGTHNGAPLSWTPGLYYSQPGPGDWSFGVGAYVPYGLVTDYDWGWAGRYHALHSEVMTLDINPALAYRVTRQLSLGAGIDLVYGTSELTNAIDFGSLLTARLGPMPQLGISPGNPAADGESRLSGDDWALGWNLGLLWEIDPRTRLGAAYRSKADFTLEGEHEIRVPAALTQLTGGSLHTEVLPSTSRLTLPATLRLGLYRELGRDWSVMAGAMWTGWHSFQEIRIRYADGRPDFVDPQEWNDVWQFSLGAEYRWSPHWSFRAGYLYDESPASQATKGPRVVERDPRWLTLGASYAVSDALVLDFAYSYVLIGDFSVDLREQTTPQASGGALPGNRLSGDYSDFADVASLGLRWRF
jgi:long-chain fatty acid transport protein